MSGLLDVNELVKRAIKYLVEGLMVAIAAFAIPKKSLNMDVNAGHDLNLKNLKFLKFKIPFLYEVSIGHSLISDSIYFGLENTVKMYLSKLT